MKNWKTFLRSKINLIRYKHHKEKLKFSSIKLKLEIKALKIEFHELEAFY